MFIAPFMRDEFVSSASYWRPEYTAGSAWLDHAPFVFWLIETLKPPTFVDLESDRASSYFAVCQAIELLQLGSRAFNVSSGAVRPGGEPFEDEVFRALSEYNKKYD